MIRRFLLPCLVCTAATLTGCGSTGGYKGPSLKFGIGYEGIEMSVTLISKAPSTAPTQAGADGKSPAPSAP